MASTLLLPEGMRPTNLHLTPMHWDQEAGAMIGHKARFVSADMYDICNRVQAIDPRLYLLELEQRTAEGESFGYAIMERCEDGVDRLVFRVTKDKLTDRVIEKLQYLMSVSLHERIKICDAERAAWEAQQREDQLEEAYERIGGPMLTELHRNGFVDRPESYRPMNRTARRHGRRMR